MTDQPKEHQPPQSQDRQPGLESQMTPAPDHRPRFPGSGRLQGRVALITGGDSGIGRATAVLFAREGAKLAILYKDEHDDANQTLEMIRQEGSDAVALSLDIGDRAAVDKAVLAVLGRFGRIGILVNNAAEQHVREDLSDIGEAQLLRTFRTNLFAQVFLTQALLMQMESGDSIVNVTSVTAYRGSPHLMDYAASKGAVLAFTRSLAANLAPRGIRVNAVAPGPIWTPLIPATFDAEKVADFGTDTPMGRAGQPNEVAPAILFLACADGSYMTGQTLHPGGGEPTGS